MSAPVRFPRAVWSPSARVCAAFRVPDQLTPSEWAAAHRVLLAEDGVASPGPWNNDRSPHLVAFMDACGTPGVQEVAALKAGQLGATEAIRNVLGYWIDQDPGDTLLVLPTEDVATDSMRERILPMMRKCERLQPYHTGRAADLSDRRVTLTTMRLFMGWAQSPATLAGRPCRRVIYDEVDKYPQYSGREADPISLGEVRLTTYRERGFRVKFSTPTTRHGLIWQAWESCPLQLVYHVPCPLCGAYRPLSFADVHWPSAADLGAANHQAQADRIETEDLAHYQCRDCAGSWHEAQRARALLGGVWAPAAAAITAAVVATERARLAAARGLPLGRIRPANFICHAGLPLPRRLGFHLPGLISPWIKLSRLAAEFLRAQGNPARLQNWRNSFMAEPHEEEHSRIEVSELALKLAGAPPARLVPAWATLLVASGDTQKDHFHWLLRAWGQGYRSQLVDRGTVGTLAELKAVTIDRPLPLDLPGFPLVTPRMLFLDAGAGLADDERSDLARAHQVYQFALANADRVMALRGHGGRKAMTEPWRLTTTRYTPPTAPGTVIEVPYFRVNTGYWKDVLSRRLRAPADAPDAWALCQVVADANYLRELASEHKVRVRRGSTEQELWLPVTENAANHAWDLEVYQAAGADFLQAGYLALFAENLAALIQARARTVERSAQELRTPDGRSYLISDRP